MNPLTIDMFLIFYGNQAIGNAEATRSVNYGAIVKGNAEATRSVNYGTVVKGDHEPLCGPRHPCVKAPANGYRRGCETIYRCHGGRDDNM
ncbi:hypothetical protein D5086_031402 [Populus alba]|uniref:Uncharacterized protein n=1 Tax=Populus alba TaxID=43335 RepID=A0ACC4AJD2_POPAL